MRKKLAIGAMAVAAAAVAGCSSSGSQHTSAASSPSGSAVASAASSTGPATGTAACDAINQSLNTIMGDAARATATKQLSVQEAKQAKLAANLKAGAADFTTDQSKSGMTATLKKAEQTIAANVNNYYANYSKPDSGSYGLKIINALGQVKQECGAAPWQTAI